jgi:hypothetical protein
MAHRHTTTTHVANRDTSEAADEAPHATSFVRDDAIATTATTQARLVAVLQRHRDAVHLVATQPVAARVATTTTRQHTPS